MTDLAAEIAEIEGLSVPELVRRHVEHFGREPRSRNRESLVRRCAWRLQERALGGLSGAARRRLAELMAEIDLGIARTPRRASGRVDGHTNGLAPGTIITRDWHGRTIEVRAREGGDFEWEGEVYKSLSGVAKAVTGAKWNGRLFFGLTERKRGVS